MRVGNRRKVSTMRSDGMEYETRCDTQSDDTETGVRPVVKGLVCFLDDLGWVAEVLVWFEDHLAVRIVKDYCETPQHLRADRPHDLRGCENARSILGKLCERHGHQESAEPNGLDASEASA